jgi:hypothetical protein
MSKLDEIKARFTPQRATTQVCLDGGLRAEFEEAERQLIEANREALKDPTFAGGSAANTTVQEAAERVQAIHARMADSTIELTFQALPSKRFSDLQLAHKPRKGVEERWNQDTFVPAFIQACCIDTDFDGPPADALDHPYFDNVDDAREFCLMLSAGQLDDVFNVAWRVNDTSLDVPFSVLASRTTQGSDKS